MKKYRALVQVQRAAIYIRVSSEIQAEKVSPEAQESDCRKLCEERDYAVVDVYRDTEKYQVGSRLVEPSGTRSDRPQLKRMLADADAGKFDILVAWREDRLYRGINKAFLEINQRAKEKVIKVVVVNGYYDPTLAGGMAWAAGIELDAKRDRHTMGVIGRLKAGKVWCSRPPYGYDYSKELGMLVVNEVEASWVLAMKQRYADGYSIREIRKWLIAEGAPQKGRKTLHKWSTPLVQRILHKTYYSTGVFDIQWGEETFQVNIPVIVPPEVQDAVDRRFAEYERWPAGNLKKDQYIFAGKVFCEVHNTRMKLETTLDTRNKKKIVQRGYYRCNIFNKGVIECGCAKGAAAGRVDAVAWEKLWSYISTPGALTELIKHRISDLEERQGTSEEDIVRLSAQLEDLLMEEQALITMARKRRITEEQFDQNNESLQAEIQAVKQEMAFAKTGNTAGIQQLKELALLTESQILEGVEGLREGPLNEDDAAAQIKLKRQIVNALVDRVVVPESKYNVRVDLVLKLDKLYVNELFGIKVQPSG